MRLSELRALEQPLRIIEAYNRLALDEIKGLTIQVIFANAHGNDAQVHMFVPYDDPNYADIMKVVQPKLDEAKTAADGKVTDFRTKFAAR